jgi:PLP dependent protein
VPGSVSLLGASKFQPLSAVVELAGWGLKRFGENYLQEAEAKIRALPSQELEWHFIGAVQSNKARAVAEQFSWVHAVDRLRIAKRLSDARGPDLPPLNICLQINLDAEGNKAGVEPDEASALAHQLVDLRRLVLRGLMAIPAPRRGFDAQREAFRRLRDIYDDLRGQGFDLDTLSMGMSADLDAAIAEGSTLVRVGTALFGPRPAKARVEV